MKRFLIISLLLSCCITQPLCPQEELKKVMDEYNDRVGWDKTTGWPTRQTLEAQNLKEVADELEGLGKLP